ncbi:MAG: D-alanyl-D-alanine carboxypeptidase/D-alanyl-D-alanine-endopeptidase [Bacteroidales bacterium]|nr:D-alanyl-D-alanine carboxypeptidase/D-alanyl-D-alanine-endopeptidase [Bacteroidales bacterium]
MKRTFNTGFKLLIFCFFIFMGICRTIAQNLNSVEKVLAEWKNDPDLYHATWSFKAINLSDNNIVAEYDAHKSLTPASVMKVVTTGCAFLLKNPNDLLETELQYTGTISSDSTLWGDLVIYGKGDPTLGSARFKAQQSDNLFATWKNALQNSGIKKIEGNIVADNSFFQGEPFPNGWSWGDIGNYFGAGVYGLSFMDNEYKVIFEEGKKLGEKAKISKIIPKIPDVVFVNNVTVAAANSGDQAIIYAAPNSSEIHIEGTIPMNKKDFTVRGAIPNPSLILAEAFFDYLQKSGFRIVGTALNESRRMQNPKTFYTHKIVTYEQLAYWINVRSVNFYAETMFRLLNNDRNAWKESSAFIDSILSAKNISTSGVKIKDGSGLSRENLLTSAFLCDFLTLIYKNPAFHLFDKTLPVSGTSGTLANFGEKSVIANNLRAKSGSMGGARAYAGYLENRSGETICFSVMINNFECKQSVLTKKIEALLIALAELK